MSPEQYARDAMALITRINDVCIGQQHEIVLCALLSLYRQVALASPCCADGAANHCRHLAAELYELVAQEGAEGSRPAATQPLH